MTNIELQDRIEAKAKELRVIFFKIGPDTCNWDILARHVLASELRAEFKGIHAGWAAEKHTEIREKEIISELKTLEAGDG